jgi:hypothetical protein
VGYGPGDGTSCEEEAISIGPGSCVADAMLGS